MAKKQVCSHDDAMEVEDSDKHPSWQGEEDSIFFCPDCGVYLSDSGEAVEDRMEPKAGVSNAGKAFSPRATAAQRAEYKRSIATKTTVKCSWPQGCSKTFLLYPQNIRKKNYCPQIHRAVVKRMQGLERQNRFRQKHGMLS